MAADELELKGNWKQHGMESAFDHQPSERLDLADKYLDYRSLLWQLAIYNFFSYWLRNHDRVVDIACGAGHTSHMLSRLLPHGLIWGLDCDASVIRRAKERYRSPNLIFMVQDMVTFREPADVDCIVSADSIEHLSRADGEAFVSNCVRALRPDGICIITTPLYRANRSENRQSVHRHEYTYIGFKRLLQGYFSRVAIFGRRDEMIYFGEPQLYRTMVAVCHYPRRLKDEERTDNGHNGVCGRILGKAPT